MIVSLMFAAWLSVGIYALLYFWIDPVYFWFLVAMNILGTAVLLDPEDGQDLNFWDRIHATILVFCWTLPLVVLDVFM
jgi:hypothetical protein